MYHLTGQDINRVHQDLLSATTGLSGIVREGHADYIAGIAPHLHNGLAQLSAHYLSRIAKGHQYVDVNKRTAYFATRYFLMRNGADFNGSSIDEAASDMEKIATAPNLEAAFDIALDLSERDIIGDQPIFSNYKDFYRVVIKSIGVASRLQNR